MIRKITSEGVVTTLAGSGTEGSTNGTGTAASFYEPSGVAVDAFGNVYVADCYNHLIRKITPEGNVTTLAGSGTQGNANGTGIFASFSYPAGVAVDASGNLYVTDGGNSLIRKITSEGVVTTLAGSGVYGNTNGLGTAASFSYPGGVAVDASGNVYVADRNSHLIRKITAGGVVTTLAGSGAYTYTDGIGTAASFKAPHGVAVDASGNVYVADAHNNVIRKITSAGTVTTFAGTGVAGSANGTSVDASFYFPLGVALDVYENVYVADMGNNLIRKISAVTTGIANKEIGSDALSIYPNPTSDMLSVKTSLEVNGFQITDMNGVIVSSGDQVSNGINVSALKHGLYIIQLQTNEGVATIKFAKQ